MREELLDLSIEVDPDELTDEEVLERCRRARRAEESSEMGRSRAARAILIDTRNQARVGDHPDKSAQEMMAFMHIFHPEHPGCPQSASEAREMVQE